MPITWHNINAPSPMEALRGFQGAAESIGSGFDRFSNIISQREKANQVAVDLGDESKVLAYKEALSGAKSPEEVAAIEAQRDAMLGGVGARFRAQVLGAGDARTATVQDQFTKRIAFENARVDQEQAPLRDQIMGYAVTDPAQALALLKANPNLRNAAAVHGAIVNGERDLTKYGWEKTEQLRKVAEEGRKVDMFPLEQDRTRAATEAYRAQQQTAIAQAEAAKHQIKSADVAAARLEKEMQDALRNRILGASPLSAGTLDTKEGQTALDDYLKTFVDNKNDREDILYNLNKFLPGGKKEFIGKDGKKRYEGVPVSAVLEAIRASSDNGFTLGFSRRGDDMDNKLQSLLEQPELWEAIDSTREQLNMKPKAAQEVRDALKASHTDKDSGGTSEPVVYWNPGQAAPSQQRVSDRELRKHLMTGPFR